MLIVKTTPKNQEEISAVLTALYRARAAHFERRARFREAVELLEKAETHRMKQEYREALRHIDQAIKVAPNYLEAHILRKIVIGAMN